MNSCTLVSIAKHAYRGAYACMSTAHALNEREGVGGWGRITGETRMYRDANVLSLMACDRMNDNQSAKHSPTRRRGEPNYTDKLKYT